MTKIGRECWFWNRLGVLGLHYYHQLHVHVHVHIHLRYHHLPPTYIDPMAPRRHGKANGTDDGTLGGIL